MCKAVAQGSCTSGALFLPDRCGRSEVAQLWKREFRGPRTAISDEVALSKRDIFLSLKGNTKNMAIFQLVLPFPRQSHLRSVVGGSPQKPLSKNGVFTGRGGLQIES